jgi:hypothetical protein
MKSMNDEIARLINEGYSDDEIVKIVEAKPYTNAQSAAMKYAKKYGVKDDFNDFDGQFGNKYSFHLGKIFPLHMSLFADMDDTSASLMAALTPEEYRPSKPYGVEFAKNDDGDWVVTKVSDPDVAQPLAELLYFEEFVEGDIIKAEATKELHDALKELYKIYYKQAEASIAALVEEDYKPTREEKKKAEQMATNAEAFVIGYSIMGSGQKYVWLKSSEDGARYKKPL